jgi:hypothetical protein
MPTISTRLSGSALWINLRKYDLLYGVDVLKDTYQMEGLYEFDRVRTSSGCWKGRAVRRADKAVGAKHQNPAAVPVKISLNPAD